MVSLTERPVTVPLSNRVLFERRQERSIEAALGALELRYLVEAAAFELGARIGVKLPIGKLTLGVRDRRHEIISQRAVETFTDPGVGRSLIEAAAGDQDLGGPEI
jgi:hypothetical protein